MCGFYGFSREFGNETLNITLTALAHESADIYAIKFDEKAGLWSPSLMASYAIEEGNELQLDFGKLSKAAACGQDLIPAVAQHHETLEVFMVGYVNALALKTARETGLVTFWSTSRNELWIKGKTSGDELKLVEIRVNCEQNSILYSAIPVGAGTCHTKDENGISRSGCYYRKIEADGTLTHIG